MEEHNYNQYVISAVRQFAMKYQKDAGCYDSYDSDQCPYSSSSCYAYHDTGDDFMGELCDYLQTTDPAYLETKTIMKRLTQEKLKTIERTGKSSGLTLLFDSLRCEAVTKNDFSGLKMLLHHPLEFPRVKEKGIAASTGGETYVSVSAEVVQTSPDTESIYSDKRNCFFSHEKTLLHFDKYSKPRCEIECEIVHTVKNCGCAWYYLPGNHTACSSSQSDCVHRTVESKPVLSCKKGCLTSCDEIIYDASVSSGKYPIKDPNDVEILARVTKQNQEITLNGSRWYVENFLGVVHVYFKDDTVTQYSRSLRYSLIDLISSVGGSVGLCLGFSLVSLVELAYFAFFKQI